MRLRREDFSRYSSHVPGVCDQLYAPQYDYQLVDSVQAFMSFFVQPVGFNTARGTVKTQRDTSMHLAGQFTTGVRFLCSGVRVLFIPDCLQHRGMERRDRQDADAMLLGGQLRLRIASREYLNDGPLAKFPSLIPRTWMGELAYLSPKDEEAHWQALYDPALKRMDRLAYYKITPVFIQSNQFFCVDIMQDQTRPLHATGKLGVILDGHLIRDAM